MPGFVFCAQNEAPVHLTRRATYEFRQDAGGCWLCVIDNSYGTDLLDAA
jgi:ketosteroid isomerase-like protein